MVIEKRHLEADVATAKPREMNEDASARKRQRFLAHEKAFFERLPSFERYSKSFMHRESLCYTTVTPFTDYIITTSVDGIVKFWKKQSKGIEFVRQYRAHVGSVVGVSTSCDGSLYATISSDKTVKIFDVINFDMINFFTLGFLPKAISWVHRHGESLSKLAIDSSTIYIFDGRGGSEPLLTSSNIHKYSVVALAYNGKEDAVVSADRYGMIEYWTPNDTFEKPAGVFELKSSTDLYEFRKTRSAPASITFSADFEKFAAFSFPDRQIRVFRFTDGKLIHKYNEAIQTVVDSYESEAEDQRLDHLEFGRRVATERELEKDASMHPALNVIFDDSGTFILYGSLLGLKSENFSRFLLTVVVNIHTNNYSTILGKRDGLRFLNISLYQGAPKKRGVLSMAMAASENPLLAETTILDPLLFCTAYRRPRFYIFSRDDDSTARLSDRDVYNEKPLHEQKVTVQAVKPKQLATSGTFHTTKGDIQIRLYPEAAPKAVENFVTHSRNGYYNNTIFHRVIRKFMIQGGDPLGDGTGGESIWRAPFEDEFSIYKHDRPFVLSMANAGPNTNGSQFFITTEKAPWLDDKHTVFGRATSGIDVIQSIEQLEVDRFDKPLEPPSIINISVD